MATDLVKSALANLYSLFQEEREMMQFLDQEKEKLASNLSAMVSVLEDAEEKQLKGASHGLDDWLNKLGNAVYVLDDILDDFLTEAMRDKYEGDRSCSFLSFLHPDKIIFRYNISARMKAIREKLDVINQEKLQFSLTPSAHHVSMTDLGQANANVHHNIPEERLTSPIITTDFICGREQEKEDLVRLLLEGASNHEENLSVFSIVAMGGLGKTTLARLVYNDKRVERHFHERIWICVSENFELKTLLKGIIGSSQRDDDNLEYLQKKLQDMLGAKRFLLVLDDVWNEDQEKWIHLRSLLWCGLKGSSIIVTTRQYKIAVIMETPPIQPYSLNPLSDDSCWEILRKRAFRLSVANETENLITIGKQIVKKCKGVPLVAKVLGGLLSFQTDEGYWQSVRDSELWNISDGKDPIFGPLKLSYLNLPLEYRRCFCYCAVFPKDYRIEKERIIHLWMANGLIRSKGELDIEHSGDYIVRELHLRSLIEVVEKDKSDETIVSFKMHDLIHDMAHYVVGDDIYVADGTSSKDLQTRTLHVSITSQIENSIAKKLRFNAKGLRSYINLENGPGWINLNLSDHTTLRALDFSHTKLKFLYSIDHLGSLKHLRYLNLSDTLIHELPEFICSLWNLQTLILDGCKLLKALPEGLGRLKSLRHLKMRDCLDISRIPQSIYGLTSLRSLGLVIVDDCGNSGFKLSELGRLKFVRGEMEIRHLQRLREVKDAQEANLMEKHDLDQLTLTWETNNSNDKQLEVQILEALRPSAKLKYLDVSWYVGAGFPQWMMKDIASFRYIQSLCFRCCENVPQLPALWRLPSLKSLELIGLKSLKYLVEGDGDSYEEEGKCFRFPSLERLTLVFLDCLLGVFNHANYMNNYKSCVFPCLSCMTIYRCPLLSFSALGPLPSIRYLDIDDIAPMSKPNANVQNFYSLEELIINGTTNFPESIPDQMLQGLSSLRKLFIYYCWNLKSLPEGFKYLSSLEHLKVEGCYGLVDISNAIYLLPSLQTWTITDITMDSLDSSTTGLAASLPQDTPRTPVLQSLRYFNLSSCGNLEALPDWLSDAMHLEEIRICNCPSLASIPSSFQRLAKLNRLDITNCPTLRSRCRKGTGEDWNNIKHVRRIFLDDDVLP